MIPVALVTGFLGSGKTTYLRHVARQYAGRRIAFVVNEFSRTDVDGHLLEGATDDVLPIPGGSIFCTCLVTTFVRTLTQLAQQSGLEGVIIEASGIANPKVAARMFRETGLDAHYVLTHVLSVVDPGSFPALRESLPNIVAQVEASDTLLLSKSDLFDPDTLRAIENELKTLAPGAVIHRTVACAVDIDLFAPRAAREDDGDYAKCVDPNFARLHAVLPGEFDEAAFRRALEPVRDDIYRIKGWVLRDGAAHYLDFSPSGLCVTPGTPGEAELGLVIIAHGPAADRVQTFASALKAGGHRV